MVIYKATNKVNGKSYVGQTINKAKRKIECPHCTLIGSISNMKRWHFDNCKELIYGN